MVMERALPSDGRFGSGPSKVRPEQVEAVATAPLGTSHRRPAIRYVVASIRSGLLDLYDAPADYTVLLGNGGASALWDAIAFCLVERRAQCAVMGEFSKKAARAVARAPWLDDPQIIESDAGSLALCRDEPGIDTYIYAHNETSTGVMSAVNRFGSDGALTIVDGTSAAGGSRIDLNNVDFYYFSPQKCFGSDGGLWLAFASPAALKRIEKLTAERYVPDFLNLSLAAANSAKNQTLNTPALATLFMLDEQVRWMRESGGLEVMEERSRTSSSLVYSWAEATPGVRPFVSDPEIRSHTVTTIAADPELEISEVVARLRVSGIVDIEPYRNLGSDGMRIAAFPAIEPSDVEILLKLVEAELTPGLQN